MKQKTMNNKISKYAEMLHKIFVKEFSIPKNYVLHATATKIEDGDNILGRSSRMKRTIELSYYGIEDHLQKYYNVAKKRYKLLYNIDISRKKYERTLIITILIHEMLHLYQYVPPRILYKKRTKYKSFKIIELPVYLETARIYIKYNQELIEKFNILPYGVLHTFDLIAGIRLALRYANIKIENAFSKRHLRKYWYTYIELALPIYREYGITICNYSLNNYAKYRVGSIDYIDAVYEADISAKFDAYLFGFSKAKFKEVSYEYYVEERFKYKHNH